MSTTLPVYALVEEGNYPGTTYFVLTHKEIHLVPESLHQTFLTDGEAKNVDGDRTTIFLTPQKASTTTIKDSATVRISEKSGKEDDYIGKATSLLSSAYVFWRKSTPFRPPTISLISTAPEAKRLIVLSEARDRTREWGNGRGDIEGSPQFFQKIAEDFAKEHGLQITVISGKDLLKERFGLMHAVGRASDKPPVFVNIAYNGDPKSDDWTAYVGKGVCFDSGGLNIKTASGMFDMFMDKLGAMTVLSAFQAVVKEKIPINLTCTIGLVENFINENNYRPSDIITSRKGLTVEIGNTDAEGRLVLADCMNWVQEHFKVKTLIELSTLTGAIISALGNDYTGLFTNSEELASDLKKVGEQVHERSWHMPCSKVHTEMVSPKHCDLTNNSSLSQASPSQAAAFLKAFVEGDTQWAHLDIAGTSMVNHASTGWGTRLLVEYACSVSRKHGKPHHH